MRYELEITFALPFLQATPVRQSDLDSVPATCWRHKWEPWVHASLRESTEDVVGGTRTTPAALGMMRACRACGVREVREMYPRRS